jgi:hypothetical protein
MIHALSTVTPFHLAPTLLIASTQWESQRGDSCAAAASRCPAQSPRSAAQNLRRRESGAHFGDLTMKPHTSALPFSDGLPKTNSSH